MSWGSIAVTGNAHSIINGVGSLALKLAYLTYCSVAAPTLALVRHNTPACIIKFIPMLASQKKGGEVFKSIDYQGIGWRAQQKNNI